MTSAFYSLVTSSVFSHLERVIDKKLDLAIEDFEVLFDWANSYHVTGNLLIPETDLSVYILSTVQISKNALGNYFTTYVDALISLLNPKRSNSYICHSSTSFSSDGKVTLSGNDFWEGVKKLTGLGKEERDYLNAQPSISTDPSYWKNCLKCSQQIVKHVAYADCLECEHLCRRELNKAMAL